MDYGQLRATDADRDKANEMLQEAYADGRLSWGEFDDRSTALAAAKTHDQLATLTADLGGAPVPAPYPPPSGVRARPGTNSLAIASLACGIGQAMFWIFSGIPAIVLGHIARKQIRRTGQDGDGMALGGLILGYVGVLLSALLLILIFWTLPGAPARPSAAQPRAATPASADAGPFAGDHRWLQGLGVLERQMSTALPAGIITPQSLRLTAARLGRCPAELAAIGPPPSLYQPTERAARRACAVFVQAARLAAAAAGAYTTAGTGPAAGTFGNLLNRTDAAVNRGVYLISNAYYGAPVIAP
jgi:hypothetical protein